MRGPIIIGIDHGYAAMKTAHFSFPTGLVEYEHEPDPHPVKRTTKKYKDFTRHRKYAVLCNRRFG